MLVEESTVPSAALPVAAFKDHLRMGSGFADDAVQDATLEVYLRAALAAIEARTGKMTIERAFSVSFTGWRETECQTLPLAPVSQVVEIALIDQSGGIVLADLSDVTLVRDTHRPRIVAAEGNLPAIPNNGYAKVQVTCGYGPDWADLPADLGQAVMLLAAHFYENRTDQSGKRNAMPFGVTSLIERFRNVRLFGGAGQ